MIQHGGMLEVIGDRPTGDVFQRSAPLRNLLVVRQYRFPPVGLVRPAQYEIVEYKCECLE